jgi:tetratricopeptide (TPR) repeat protein
MFSLFGDRKPRYTDPSQAMAAGDHETALAMCEERLRREPRNAAQWQRRIAECHLAAGRRAEAVRSYLAAAAELEKQDLLLQAIAIYAAVRRLDPENAEVAARLGEVAADEARAPSRPEPEVARSMTIRTRLRRYAPLFSEFDREELTQILAVTELHQLPLGSIVFRQGDPGDSIFVVVEGQVTLTVGGIDGTPVAIETITDGGCFGEVSALSRVPRNVTATTAAPTELLELSRDYLEAVAIAHPRVWQVLEAFQKSRLIPAGI